jgi:two-component system, chemotaxis family, chemotaxis protein CheY
MSADRSERRYKTDVADVRQGKSIAADRSRPGEQILVVEDDVGSRRAMTNMLEDQGYRVSAVGTITEALERLRQGRLPELIVLDLMLPDMEGWDFRHEQKKDPALRHIPVIGVSAIGKLVDVEYSLRKPLDYDEFLAAVQRYVMSPARPANS